MFLQLFCYVLIDKTKTEKKCDTFGNWRKCQMEGTQVPGKCSLSTLGNPTEWKSYDP